MRHVMSGKLLRALAAVVLAGCTGGTPYPLGSGLVPDETFHAQARAAFIDYQAISFAEDIEVCGYFGLDANGAFVATDPVGGTMDSCTVWDIPDTLVDIVASYHTHSSFDPRADSEVPSTDDVLSDMDEQVFGYIGTPGGRFWLVDWRTATATQLCGLYCLSSDVDFIQGDAGRIAPSYSLDDLYLREGG